MPIKKRASKIIKISSALLLSLFLFNIPIFLASAAGSLQWNSPYDEGVIIANAVGDISSNPVNQNAQQIVRTTDGFFVIAWADDINETDSDIYAQKINSSGVIQWTLNGLPIVTATGDQPSAGDIALISSDNGSVIIAWTDNRSIPESVYIQKIDTDGTPLWTSNGVLMDSNSKNPFLLSDKDGGAFILWENNAGADSDVKFTHILSTGLLDALYDPPLTIGSTGPDDINPKMIWADGTNLIIAAEKDDGVKKVIQLIKGDALTLAPSWGSNVTLESTTYDLGNYQMIHDGTGGAYVVFEEQNPTNYNLYLQRINNAGNLVLTAPGKTICNSTGHQTNPHLVSDNIGTPNGTIISWDDERAGGGAIDIYAQRTDGTNISTRWTYNGKPLSNITDSKQQSGNKIISNNANGAIISFIDNQTTFTDIRAQHLNSSGALLWSTNGELMETDQTANYIDSSPIMASAGNGDALLTWIRQAGIASTTDVHAQYIKDTVGSLCAETGGTSFCGSQQISDYVLSFIDIPDSFNFGTITTGSTTNNCNNTSTLASPSNVCSDNSIPDPPGNDDLLTVRDERDSGGFVVQVTTQGTFTDGTNVIPLDKLFMVTTIDETDPNKAGGINYSDIFIGPKTIIPPLYIQETSTDISNPATYISGWSNQNAPNDTLKISQFGGYPLDIMNGTLTASSGRVGDISLFTNFNLTIDFNQEPGEYSIILTYDLTDSTTP